MTKVWGPPGWLFFHCITFGYPFTIDDSKTIDFQKRNYYKNFFYYLGKVLPCRYCRESYDQFFKEIPIDNYLNNRKDLCLWLYKMHNKVNHKLGIPECDIPKFEDVQKQYESYRAQCKKTTDEDREKNLLKGCVIPKDGINKKSYLEVINSKKEANYILIKKTHLTISIISIILLIIIIKQFF